MCKPCSTKKVVLGGAFVVQSSTGKIWELCAMLVVRSSTRKCGVHLSIREDEVWSLAWRVWSVKCKQWSVEWKVLSVEWKVWTVEWKVCRVKSV